MPTCSELNVRNLPQANIAPGSAGTHRKCTALPSAAPPTRSGTVPAMPPMPAPPSPGSVSCHEKHATDTILRTFCTNTTSFAYFQSKSDREPTATASCYESPCKCPVTKSEEKIHKSGHNRAQLCIRYPIDTLPIPDFRKIPSHFTTHMDALGPILDRIGRILAHVRGFTVKETDATIDFGLDFAARRRSDPK